MTGDKIETAVTIGYACALLYEDMKLYYITETNPEKLTILMNETLETVKNIDKNSWGLIVSGDALLLIV